MPKEEMSFHESARRKHLQRIEMAKGMLGKPINEIALATDLSYQQVYAMFKKTGLILQHRKIHKAWCGGRGMANVSPEVRREVARKGGCAISQNREHMRLIGKRGGLKVSRDSEHMSRIGKLGVLAKRRMNRSEKENSR